MVSENIKNFIWELIKKTESGNLKWREVDKIDAWETIKKQIEKEKIDDLKGYFINADNSYGIRKCGGYVILLNAKYSNSSIFSSALDKYLLFIKINDELLPENLSSYDCQGYRELLQRLIKVIKNKEKELYNMPDCMYEFFEKILGEDENDRITDE